MTRSTVLAILSYSAVAVTALCASRDNAEAAYQQTNLVSSVSGLASVTDSSLVNPWGISFIGPTPSSGPFWISNQGTNTTTVYSVVGTTGVSGNLLTVAIPTTAGGPNGPTGQVSNTGTSFRVGDGGDGGAALFIFANLNGAISAWDGGSTAFVQQTTPGAVYTGLAKNQAQTMLYAANASDGAIDVFDGAFNPVTLGAGAFATPAAIAASSLVPFNVHDIGGSVYVTYAPAGRAAQTTASAGEGAVAVFDENGVLKDTIMGGPLAAPWGVAVAPAGFGQFGGDLLVGNFSFKDSRIDAFDPATGEFVGSIAIDAGAGQTAGGLWDMTFGTGGNNGSPTALYFSDGINGETGGLFGVLTPVPEPSTWAMMVLGFAGLGFAGYLNSRGRAVPA
ncbi:uncharacterized protein (TIGR03118 family) [Roseiarcus fermentans]|uniref:Uncharacterized protein (TIGR03118 family) n=1 Tax=Roseiarcus fermentans TaxID=1473586 RepID=A0A366EPF2_9HYPH|nr:TIGR03118 family protein [Roseiarcus fermentans]RBP03570.1 uncharacterized protein (TIGR03118 family) [Roseiarcus fermentans]